mmetsp:Transcript_160359/g.282995  ORF Transcript_160359/g.282995 Transcript_160359/m.282995 type:complete len:209 (+) Transcript_160359:445-1071(+)
MNGHAVRCLYCNLKLLQQESQLALDPPAKLLVNLASLRQDLEPQKMFELSEVRKWFVHLVPLRFLGLYALDDVVTAAKLIQQNSLGSLSHVVCRVHGRKGWCDDGHDVLLVGRIGLWVPDLEASHARHLVNNLAKHDRLRPTPLVVDPEEAIHELAGRIMRIKLTDACHQQRPCDAAKKAEHIGVDSPPPSPALYKSERLPERLLTRH